MVIRDGITDIWGKIEGWINLIIVTDKLILQEVTEDDFDALYAVFPLSSIM
jgi:hypothetical protein